MQELVPILIVDHDVTSRFLHCKLLDKLGFQSDSAANGQEALERMKGRRYRLIIMDLHMPTMDGYEAIKVIRQIETGENRAPVPIIALGSLPDDTMCLGAGMTDFYHKPLMEPELTRLLSRWMSAGCALE